MKAVVLESAGLEGLKPVDRPVPEPGPGEVVVRLRAASLNYRDLVTLRMARPDTRAGFVPLSDGCGEIAALGAGVTRVRTGDRVAPQFFPDWISGPANPEVRATALGGPADGCLQQYLRIRAEGVTRAPEHLSDLEVAALPCAGLTAWRALVIDARIKAGDTVVVQGTGGVSMLALQLARLLGARVIATSSSDEKLERARALGASDGIHYRRTPEWGRQVRELTGGRGAECVIDVAGGKSLAQSLEAVAHGGHVAVVGILEGFEASLPIGLLMSKTATVRGTMVGNRHDTEEMFRAIALHRMRPAISHSFDFDAHRQAFETQMRAEHFGKVCIRID
jgi:NADPH:quinone reductase-like Zn-dependent oxidoreductase